MSRSVDIVMDLSKVAAHVVASLQLIVAEVANMGCSASSRTSFRKVEPQRSLAVEKVQTFSALEFPRQRSAYCLHHFRGSLFRWNPDSESEESLSGHHVCRFSWSLKFFVEFTLGVSRSSRFGLGEVVSIR